MKALKRFGKGLIRTAWSTDWFHWFLLGIYVFFGVVGGIVISELTKEFR